MAVKTYPEAPYYDDYNTSKDFVQVLAHAGNYAQSREFTQMGTMQRDFLGRLGDAVLSNGQIISGCDLVISNSVATLTEGRIYLDGIVRIIETPLTCSITGTGTEIIGVKITEEVITAAEDESLRNPAIGTEGYNSEGASRVRQTVSLVVDDPDAASIYTLKDGVIYTEVVADDDDAKKALLSTLAKRTYDVSGNFKVEGLELMNKETTGNTSQIYINAGLAYIQGYEVQLRNMTSIDLEIPTEFRSCLNEPKTYVDTNEKYYFNNNPLKSVDHITTHVEVTREITRGSIGGGTDELPDQPVQEIVSVVQGTTTYVAGTDFQQSGNYIDWSLGGDEPSSGSTYEVTYVYLYDNVDGTDYEILGSGNEKYFQFKSTGTLPIEGSQILIDYNFYLSRVDTIIMDKSAQITILKGVPDKAILAQAPANGDKTKLTLGTVLSYANTTEKSIENLDTSRLTQLDLGRIKDRVDDLEYNQAQKDLDVEAKEGEDPTSLKGIYTDGFVGFTKADVTNSEYKCSMDMDKGEITVPYSTGVVKLTINDTASTQYSTTGRVLTAPYRDAVVASQDKATTKFLVNPYAVYNNRALLALNPAVDDWIDTSEVTVQGGTRVAYYSFANWSQAYAAGITGSTVNQTSVTTSIQKKTATVMRQNQITVTGTNFEPSEDNIACFFNGARVTMTNQSIEGSSENTVRASDIGTFTFKFTVPAGVPTGSVEVRCEGPISTSTATYTSHGTMNVKTNTVYTATRQVVSIWDPLAQSFQFDEDTVITSLDLCFAAKDNTRACVVQIRNMVNGYPGTTCYTEKAVLPTEINSNGNRPVVTKIRFDQPVHCEADTQYCFVVLSDSNAYMLWQATLGETDVTSGKSVASQPYVNGVMFSSSNGVTWSAHQGSDLTFALYKSEFTGQGEVVFENISGIDFDRIMLAVSAEDPSNSGIEWSYRVNGAQVWEPIEIYTERRLDVAGTEIDLRAKINVTQDMSPAIANDCINLVYTKNETTGTYVSKQVEFAEPFTDIKVDVQFALPTGSSARVYYKLPDVADEWVQMTNPETSQVDNEFDEYIYTVSGISARKYRVKIELETTNPVRRPRARKLMNILKY